jgi:uncharacterized membrane protein YgcG
LPPSNVGNPVTFRITSPTGNLATIDQTVPTINSGYFTASFQLDGGNFKKTGMYSVLVQDPYNEWNFKFQLIEKNPSTLDYHKSLAPQTPKTPIDPMIILIIISLAAVGIIVAMVSKRKKVTSSKKNSKGKGGTGGDGKGGDGKGGDGEKETIHVDKFLDACEFGSMDEFLSKFKTGKTEQDYQKALRILVSNLKQRNAPPITMMYVMSLIQGNKSEPTIPKRPDAPRLSNASTTVQPLRVNVSWAAPNNGGSEIISYDLYRSATGKSKGFHLVERGIRGLTFTDTLSSEGIWYYDIIANNSIGSSPPSLAASITVEGRGESGGGGRGESGGGGRGESGGGGRGESGGGRKTSYTEEEIQAHKTLGISPGASETEIKTAHRKLIIKYHPDKAKSASQIEDFTKITMKVNDARSKLLKK